MVGHEDTRLTSGNLLPPFNPYADTGHAVACANDKAGYCIERINVAGYNGQRNKDRRCGNAQRENDDNYNKRNNHVGSVIVLKYFLPPPAQAG